MVEDSCTCTFVSHQIVCDSEKLTGTLLTFHFVSIYVALCLYFQKNVLAATLRLAYCCSHENLTATTYIYIYIYILSHF